MRSATTSRAPPFFLFLFLEPLATLFFLAHPAIAVETGSGQSEETCGTASLRGLGAPIGSGERIARRWG